MFVGGLDVLKATTCFSTQCQYAWHSNFQEGPPKIKWKPTCKGVFLFCCCLVLVFFIKEEESTLKRKRQAQQILSTYWM